MSFISRYLESVHTLECPESYHVFSCLGMLSCLPGRRIWSRRGQIVTYPNLYVVLVGEQGSGKTVAMREARNIIRGIKEINEAAKSSTARAFIQSVEAQQQEFLIGGVKHKHAPVACFLSELSNFIALSPESMIPFLIDAYDDDRFDYVTQNKGSVHIVGPAISMVACCTHQWITAKMKDDIISGGFTGRTLWIYEKQRGKLNPEPELTKEMIRIQDELREECRQIMKLSGEFIWSESAKKTYNDWYHEYYKNPESMEGYANRKKVQVEKIAMLLALSNRKEMLYRSEDFTEALKILDMMEKNLGQVFQGIGRNELNSVGQEMVDFLKSSKNGGIKETDLRMMFYRKANMREIEELLIHLQKTRQIQKMPRGGETYFKYLPKLADKEDHTEEREGQ